MLLTVPVLYDLKYLHIHYNIPFIPISGLRMPPWYWSQWSECTNPCVHYDIYISGLRMPPWNWSQWSECTNPCGGDSQRRFRSCRGQNCLYPADSQTRECMPKQCSKKHIYYHEYNT